MEEQSITYTTREEVAGAGLAFISMTFWTLGTVSVQALAGAIPDFELNAIRLIGKLRKPF